MDRIVNSSFIPDSLKYFFSSSDFELGCLSENLSLGGFSLAQGGSYLDQTDMTQGKRIVITVYSEGILEKMLLFFALFAHYFLLFLFSMLIL